MQKGKLTLEEVCNLNSMHTYHECLKGKLCGSRECMTYLKNNYNVQNYSSKIQLFIFNSWCNKCFQNHTAIVSKNKY